MIDEKPDSLENFILIKIKWAEEEFFKEKILLTKPKWYCKSFSQKQNVHKCKENSKCNYRIANLKSDL